MLSAVKLFLVLFLLGVWMGMAANPLDVVAADSTRTSAIDGISITADNQILVELMPDDTTPANRFDLNGRTLVFTPDGQGGYSRQVQALDWEEDIGEAVADGAVIVLESFGFDFAGWTWDSFYVSRHGALTFGGPMTYDSHESENRFATMREIAGKFVDTPTISPLYKPRLGEWGTGTQHVARWPDRVVVTWITTEPAFYVHGVPPEKPARFQAVLRTDGSIRFNYSDVAFGDGIVGLFPDDEIVEGDLIASIVDARDSELPGHLDLLEAAIYTTNADSKVILEFTTREPIPEPDEGTVYSYRLYFDTDKPFWTRPDWSDLDLAWQIDVKAGGEWTARGDVHAVELLESDTSNQVALLADISDLEGLSASVLADAAQFDNDSYVQGNLVLPPAQIELPVRPRVDLSRSDLAFSRRQSEVFRYRGAPDPVDIACRIIDILGDRFDHFVFHNEFRIDSQESATPVKSHYGNARVWTHNQ